MAQNFDLFGAPPLLLDGEIKAIVQDPDGSPNFVLERTKAFSIQVDWTISGSMAGAIGGEWHLHAFVESMGPGPERDLGGVDVPLNTVPPATPRHYTKTLSIPAGTITQDGTYKLTIVLTYTNLGVPNRMAGFVEGPMLQFYTP